MEELQVTFRMVTPLFLSGTDQRQTELRLPSIKGALRFWYRAINPNYKKIIEQNKYPVTYEEELFGSARPGLGRGQFLMRTKKNQRQSQVPYNKEDSIFSGDVGYLSFSMGMQERGYMTPEQNFTLRFAFRPSCKDISASWRGLTASLWLLGHIGGLGSRSRRGFGTVALESWIAPNIEVQQIIDSLPIAHCEQTTEKWMNRFSQGLAQLQEWFPSYNEVDHTCLDPNTTLYLGKRCHSWNEALGIGAVSLANFRKQKEYRLALGLPMLVMQDKVNYRPDKLDGERVASPVSLRVICVKGAYYPLYVLLSTPFPRVVKVNTKNEQAKKEEVSFSQAMSQFVQDLEKEGYQQVLSSERGELR